MFKKGDQVVCIGMHPGYDVKLNVGQVYTVEKINEDHKYLYVKGSNANFAMSYFRLAEKAKLDLYRVKIKNGFLYRIRCSEEEMKELAEIIGDDHLEGIETVKISKKDKSKTPMKES